MEFWYYHFFAGAGAALMLVWLTARLWLRMVKNKARHALAMARQEAELSKNTLLRQAEQTIAQRTADAEQDIARRQNELSAQSAEVSVRLEDISRRDELLEKQTLAFEKKRAAVDAEGDHYRERLRQIAGMDEKTAREALKAAVALQCDRELAQLRNELLSKGETQLHEEAKRVLVACMQRVSSTVPLELGASIVKLPSEEFKGRIIGKEGRNIRCFESATGTTLMIDESPETVLVSSFDPVRREIARLALENLIADGRIHPSTIEDAVKAAEDFVKNDVYTFGENALARLGMHDVPREVTALLGRLHYHLSNNQNTLEHTIEVASICGLIAAELGLDVHIAQRAGLFHDIGKALTEDLAHNHAAAGAALLRRYGEDMRVVNAVAAHHEEVLVESIYAPLVMLADKLSATRPGARADAIDGYIARVEALESLARDFDGVDEAYALQAGREIRVMVSPERMDDADARELARLLRLRIESELTYPGAIKVTIIREQRYTEVAK